MQVILLKKMINSKLQINGARVAILGLTFKENVADVRNTKVNDIVDELMEYGVDVLVHDPKASPKEVKEVFGFDLVQDNELKKI